MRDAIRHGNGNVTAQILYLTSADVTISAPSGQKVPRQSHHDFVAQVTDMSKIKCANRCVEIHS